MQRPTEERWLAYGARLHARHCLLLPTPSSTLTSKRPLMQKTATPRFQGMGTCSLLTTHTCVHTCAHTCASASNAKHASAPV
eukprot:270746-Chlamydomonas_euryale.AAC.14